MGGRQVKDLKRLAMKEVDAELNRRLDKIEAACQSQLDKMDRRAKAVEGFLTQVVKVEIQNDLYNANVTIDAVVAVLADAGLNIPDFAAKVDAKKKEIDEKRKADAAAKMKADMESRAAAAKAAAQPSEPTVEEPKSAEQTT